MSENEVGTTGSDLGETGGSGTMLSRLIWTFVSPRNLFAAIARDDVHWWQPWVWVSLLSAATAYISIPIQIRLTRMNPNDMPPEQLEQTLTAMQKYGYLGVISTPVAVLVSSLVVVAISYMVVSVLAEHGGFKKYFALYLHCSIVSAVGLLLATWLTVMKGVENIRAVEDASSSFGPAIFLSPGNKLMHALFSTFDIFYIWFYVLLWMGVSHVFKLSGRAAILVVVPVWLLFLLITLVTARVSPS